MTKTVKEKLDAVVAIAIDPGNAHADHYLRGMANGLLVAQSIVHELPSDVETPFIPETAVKPPFDYMAEADKTCSVIFTPANINRNELLETCIAFIAAGNVLNLYKKVLFRGKMPENVGLATPTLDASLAAEWDGANENVVNAIHGIIGVATEASEAVENLVKMLESPSGQSFDGVNLFEEAGDIGWYRVRMLRAIGVTLELCDKGNIEKLRGRHGHFGFDVDRDWSRDLVAERAQLETKAPLFDRKDAFAASTNDEDGPEKNLVREARGMPPMPAGYIPHDAPDAKERLSEAMNRKIDAANALGDCEGKDVHRAPRPGMVWEGGCWRSYKRPIGDIEGMDA